MVASKLVVGVKCLGQVRFEVDNAEQIVGLEAGCHLGTGGTDRDPLRSLAICGQVEFGRIVGIQSALIPAVRSSDQDVKLILIYIDPGREQRSAFSLRWIRHEIAEYHSAAR